MSVKVRIPAPLRHVTRGQAEVEMEAHDLAGCLDALEAHFPGMKERLCQDQGELQPFINIYVNREDVQFLQGLATPLKPGDEVIIVPAIAGG